LSRITKVLKVAIAKQQANLSKYRHRIVGLNDGIRSRRRVLKTKKKELKMVKKERLEKEASYNRDRKKRSEENAIIRKLQKIVKDRLSRMSQFLRTKTNK